MAEVLVCSQCGGMLDENYTCPYCGAHYKKPETTNNVTNIVINNNFAATPPVAANIPAPEPQPEPEPQTEPEPQQEQEQEVSVEQEPHESGLTEFVNNSFGLMAILLIAAVGLCIYGVNTNNDLLIGVGIVVGIVFVFLSSKMKPKSDNSDGKDDDDK